MEFDSQQLPAHRLLVHSTAVHVYPLASEAQDNVSKPARSFKLNKRTLAEVKRRAYWLARQIDPVNYADPEYWDRVTMRGEEYRFRPAFLGDTDNDMLYKHNQQFQLAQYKKGPRKQPQIETKQQPFPSTNALQIYACGLLCYMLECHRAIPITEDIELHINVGGVEHTFIMIPFSS